LFRTFYFTANIVSSQKNCMYLSYFYVQNPIYSSIQLISLFISSALKKKKKRSKTFCHEAVFRIPVTSIMSAISTPRRWSNRVNNRLDYRVRSFQLVSRFASRGYRETSHSCRAVVRRER